MGFKVQGPGEVLGGKKIWDGSEASWPIPEFGDRAGNQVVG